MMKWEKLSVTYTTNKKLIFLAIHWTKKKSSIKQQSTWKDISFKKEKKYKQMYTQTYEKSLFISDFKMLILKNMINILKLNNPTF